MAKIEKSEAQKKAPVGIDHGHEVIKTKAAPVGIDQVHEVIAERQERQQEKAKAAVEEKNKATAAKASAPAPLADPSCAVDAPRLSAAGHQAELGRFRINLAQRQLTELGKKYPVVAALIKENAALKSKTSK